MKFPHELFKKAGLNSTDVSGLFGVSRVTGARWLSGTDRNGNDGVGVNLFLQDKVKKLESSLRAAVESGRLPNDAITTLPPNKRLIAIRKVLKQDRT